MQMLIKILLCLVLCSVACGQLKLDDLKTEIITSPLYDKLNQKQWDAKIVDVQVDTKSGDNLVIIRDQMVDKIARMREQLTGDWSGRFHPSLDGKTLRPSIEIMAELDEGFQQNLLKQGRLLNALACTLKEIELRDANLVTRKIHDTIYYCDYDNGGITAGTVHDGLAEPADPGGAVYTAVDGTTTATDTTHCCLAINDFDNDTDDNYNGDYLYNVTRSIGVQITDYDADDGDDASVLIHPTITGQVAGDTFYILRAMKYINQYTENTRVAGDILYVRADQTHDQGTDGNKAGGPAGAGITFLSSGDGDDYISVIGCDSVTNDPWVDSNDVKPIIDFENTAFKMAWTGDTFWYYKRLVVQDKAGTYMLNGSSGSNNHFLYFKDCDFDGVLHTSYGAAFDRSQNITFDGCTFDNFLTMAINILQSTGVLFKDCEFIAHTGSDRAIACGETSIVYLDTVTFTGTYDNSALRPLYGSTVYCRNVDWGGNGSELTTGVAIYSEDDDATFESHISTFYPGTITRGTASPRAGGANSYAIMLPFASCGLNNPLVLGDAMSGFAKIWLVKDVQVNISAWARVDSAWDGALTAAQCYAEFSWLNHAANATRTVNQSTETISNVADWTTGVNEFTSGAFTPLQTGFVYVWFTLAHTEDVTEKVWVDIKPVVN